MRGKINQDITLIDYLHMYSNILDNGDHKVFTVVDEFILQGNDLFVKEPRFIKGQWYTHTEPGQEKFLIRIEDPEKQVCSGWDCKGEPFKNEWVHLGSRLQPADLNAGEISVLGMEIENFK